jgi:polysaccharide export outer membrane protein
MNRYLRILSVGLAVISSLGACSSPGSDLPVLPSTSPTLSSYHLGAGDLLDINVFGADELRGRYPVQDDGTISMLLIGKIPAAGHTVDEIEKDISARLKKGSYVTKPEVTISVVTYRPFYILGEVARPGGYPYASGMRVLSAVAAAQGYTYRANQDYVIITRNGDEGKGLGLTPIQPDDIIRVPERYF